MWPLETYSNYFKIVSTAGPSYTGEVDLFEVFNSVLLYLYIMIIQGTAQYLQCLVFRYCNSNLFSIMHLDLHIHC